MASYSINNNSYENRLKPSSPPNYTSNKEAGDSIVIGDVYQKFDAFQESRNVSPVPNIISINNAVQPGVGYFPMPYISFTGAFVFSCLSFWCCGFLFGLIAIILAVVGQSNLSNGNPGGARFFLNCSYACSTLGFVLGIFGLIAFILIFKYGLMYKYVEAKFH